MKDFNIKDLAFIIVFVFCVLFFIQVLIYD